MRPRVGSLIGALCGLPAFCPARDASSCRHGRQGLDFKAPKRRAGCICCYSLLRMAIFCGFGGLVHLGDVGQLSSRSRKYFTVPKHLVVPDLGMCLQSGSTFRPPPCYVLLHSLFFGSHRGCAGHDRGNQCIHRRLGHADMVYSARRL